jgi:hypothetical protein
LLTETVEAVTAPAVPQNTASLPSVQTCGVPRLVFHQLAAAVLHVPEPPRFAPVEALLPAVEPSVSQYKVPARAGLLNSNTAITAKTTTATARSASECEPFVRFGMRRFKMLLKEGMTTDVDSLLPQLTGETKDTLGGG